MILGVCFVSKKKFLICFFALMTLLGCLVSNTITDFILDLLVFRNHASAEELLPIREGFRLFDGTLYLNKPDLKPYGVKTVKVIYEAEMWGNPENYPRLPDKIRIKSAAHRAGHEEMVVLDIEHWKLVNDNHDVNSESLSKYIKVLEWFREFEPDIKLGFYGHPPIMDYWRAIDAKPKHDRNEWMQENNQIRPLAESVDILFPSLYTFYTDREGWVRYAKAQVSEARRIAPGKPIYVFIWPQYHSSNKLLGCQYVPDDFWRLQLKVASQLADGAIIWGGWDVCKQANGRELNWDADASWWHVTRDFIKNELGIDEVHQ